jgi:hypothetical protein
VQRCLNAPNGQRRQFLVYTNANNKTALRTDVLTGFDHMCLVGGDRLLEKCVAWRFPDNPTPATAYWKTAEGGAVLRLIASFISCWG